MLLKAKLDSQSVVFFQQTEQTSSSIKPTRPAGFARKIQARVESLKFKFGELSFGGTYPDETN